VEAIFEDVLLHKAPGQPPDAALEFASGEAEPVGSPVRKVQEEWQNAAEREPFAHMFAQETISSGEVAQEVDAFGAPLGSGWTSASFCRACTAALQASITEVGIGHQGAHRGQPPGCSACCSRVAADSR